MVIKQQVTKCCRVSLLRTTYWSEGGKVYGEEESHFINSKKLCTAELNLLHVQLFENQPMTH